FEYQSLSDLAQYFIHSHSAQLATLLDARANESQTRAPAMPAAAEPKTQLKPGSRRIGSRRRFAVAANRPDETSGIKNTEPIAIVGLSGRYPGARDIEAYWLNLRDGKDCIIEVPKDRWDWREYF